tara:strand:- start:2098 stop:4119 length:2022 start_codon:yes stop_codon:yes gene_type:complete
MKINYRPDIDGLRAIAVISVIFYHAEQSIKNFKILPGGFVGVDIFFVISGFLITSIILKELKETKKFSFVSFYIRRVKRIMPVFLLVFITTFPFIWLFFIPVSFVDYSKSLFSSLFFLSNYHFYFSGELYDAENSLLKPLMHTWSLSIEEQFYVVFPLLLFVCFTFLKNHLSKIIFFTICISFLFMIFIFQKNESLAFFSFFSRFWELMCGSLIAVLNYNKKETYGLSNNIYSLIGLIFLFFSVFFFNDNTNFPYYSTSIPVIGTSLIIYFNNKENLIYKILSLKFLVYLGLISYSLYLWHYPVFAIGRITEFFGDGVSKKLFIITFALSLITYHAIEKPIKNKTFSNFSVFVFLGFFYFVLIIISQLSISGKIKAIRGDILDNLFVGQETSNLTVCKDNYINNQGYCVFNPDEKKTLILVGDSHMQTIEKPLLEFSNTNKFKLIILNRSTCFYFRDLDLVVKNKISQCSSDYQKLRSKIILSENNPIVIMGGRTQYYLSGQNFDNNEGGGNDKKSDGFYYKKDNALMVNTLKNSKLIKDSLNKTINELLSNNSKILLIYPIPEVGWNVSKKIISRLVLNSGKLEMVFASNPLTTSHKVFLKRTSEIYDIYNNINSENVFKIYPEKILCNKLIKNRCITHDQRNVFYIDDDHLSYTGAKLLVDEIKTTIFSIQ